MSDDTTDINEAIERALEKYDMERSKKAEELGKLVAGLQD